ncbi:MAG TPA: CAP domain-containing protein [Candidatus Aquilonibacter sp.]|nr:CAP domain-containing protein [Candidatus Aquilonibacter sp.]
MLALLFAVLLPVTAVDASSGSSLTVPVSVSPVAGSANEVRVVADGWDQRYASFHGTFPSGSVPRRIALLRLTDDERNAVVRVNAFRRRFGLAPLHVDENLMETARYWATQERRSGRIGHTCAALGSPAGCIEFNAYFHRLPGAPADWFSGQNAAFDTYSTWGAPVSGFENEETATTGERGHFLNLVDASRWIGLGETRVPGYGSYFAMNLM